MSRAASATFFLSTGRCGTQWFHDALTTVHAGRAVVTHEPLCGVYHPKRYLRNAAGLAAEPRFAAHLNDIARRLDGGQAYIETGWPCYPAAPLLIERLGGRVRFVHLIRNPVNVALSLATHQVYTRDDWVGSGALEPGDPGVRHKDLAAGWADMPDYERTLFWWTEVNLYIQEIQERFPAQQFLLLRYEDFFDPLDDVPVHALAEFIDLGGAAALDGLRLRNVDRYRYVMSPVDWQVIFKYPVTCALAERFGYNADALRAAARAGDYEHYKRAKSKRRPPSPPARQADAPEAPQSSPGAVDHGRLAALKARGRGFLNSGRPYQAKACMETAVAEFPGDALGWFLLGTADAMVLELAAAVDCFERAIALQEDFPEAHIGLGNLLLNQGRYDEAEAAYRRALQFAPQHAAIYLNLGHLFRVRGDHEGAVKCYGTALRLGPVDFVANTLKDLGLALLYRGLFTEAKALFDAFCKVRADDAEAWLALARVHSGLGDADQAVYCGQRMIKLRPDDAWAQLTMAVLQVCRGDRDAAVAACREALADGEDMALLQPLAAALGTRDARTAVHAGSGGEVSQQAAEALIPAVLTPQQRQAARRLMQEGWDFVPTRT